MRRQDEAQLIRALARGSISTTVVVVAVVVPTVVDTVEPLAHWAEASDGRVAAAIDSSVEERIGGGGQRLLGRVRCRGSAE